MIILLWLLIIAEFVASSSTATASAADSRPSKKAAVDVAEKGLQGEKRGNVCLGKCKWTISSQYAVLLIKGPVFLLYKLNLVMETIKRKQ